MIISVIGIMEVFMPILFLIGIIPFFVLFAVLGLAALILMATAVVEFPLVLLVAVGLGLAARHVLPSLGKKREVLCEPM
jgi:hypothetical protein